MLSKINTVEKKMGLDVSSFFKFTNWLILQNFISFMIFLLPFLCFPHIVMLETTKQVNETDCSLNKLAVSFKVLDILAADVNIIFSVTICLKKKEENQTITLLFLI
jgi:hypothetical protein